MLADTDETQRTRQYSGAAGAAINDDRAVLTGPIRSPHRPAQHVRSRARRRADIRQRGPQRSGGRDRRMAAAGPVQARLRRRLRASAALSTLFDAAEPIRIRRGSLRPARDRERRPGRACRCAARRSCRVRRRDQLRRRCQLRDRARRALARVVGQGFKVPTLFQLFSDYGNTALRPERSTSFDLSLALGSRNRLPYVSLALFRRDSRDLIDFVSCFGTMSGICAGRPFGTYDNVGRMRAQGAELEAAAEVTAADRAAGLQLLVDTRNRTPGLFRTAANTLARRPRHTLSLGGEWQVLRRRANARRGFALGVEQLRRCREPGAAALLRGARLSPRAGRSAGRSSCSAAIENLWNEPLPDRRRLRLAAARRVRRREVAV